MKTIKQEYQINAPLEKVWEALVEPKVIEKWGAGPVKMSDEEGFEFELWGGDIHGKNIEVTKNKKLIQEWYSGNWPKPSKVTFTLSSEGGSTTVSLTHENIPDEEAKDIEGGWNSYYLGKIKELLE